MIIAPVIPPNTEFLIEVAKGNVAGHSLVHKFGAGQISSIFAPVSQTSSYQTPTTAQALEFVSSSGNDTSAGTGAREITIFGLDSNWEEVTQTLDTNGTTAVQLGTDLTRLYRWFVSESGTYATETTGSHVGTLTIRDSGGGGNDWSQLPISPFPVGQSQIGAYTIPSGKTGYLMSKNVFTDTGKTADIYFFQRTNVDTVAAPYSSMRLVERQVGVSGGYNIETKSPKGPFVGPCDVGFMGKVASGTAEVSVEFELLIVDN